MMRFEWKGFTAMGKMLDGELEAESMEEAAGKLREQKIFVNKVTPLGPVQAPAPNPPPTPPPPPQAETVPVPPEAAADIPTPKTVSTCEGDPGPHVVTCKVAWDAELNAKLKRISDICEVVSAAGVPPDVIAEATKRLLNEAIDAAYYDD